jgi:hypothetical protein
LVWCVCVRPSFCPPPMVSRYNLRTDFKFCTVVWYHKIQIKFEFQCDQIIGSKVVTVWSKDFGKWVTCGKYWRIRELKRQKGIVKCNWELKKMVQIVGNLEWELLKNVEIRKSIYNRITNTRFEEVCLEQEKSHICFTSFLFDKIMLIWYKIPHYQCGFCAVSEKWYFLVYGAQTLDSWTPFLENFVYIKKNHIFSLLFNKIMFIWYEIPLRSTLWRLWKLRRTLGNIIFQTLYV